MMEQLDQERAERAQRSIGTAFEIIYQPRSEPPEPDKKELRRLAAVARQAARRKAERTKNRPGYSNQIVLNGSLPKKILRDNTGHRFCVAIPSQADNDKQKRIKKTLV